VRTIEDGLKISSPQASCRFQALNPVWLKTRTISYLFGDSYAFAGTPGAVDFFGT